MPRAGDRSGRPTRPGGVGPTIRGRPPRGPCTGGPRIAWRPFGAPEPFQERSKNPSIFQSNFQPILVAFWLPKCLPKPPKITEKSFQNRIWPKKRDFSKNSTPLEREAHFRVSREPKNTSKSTKNVPGNDQKSNQNNN